MQSTDRCIWGGDRIVICTKEEVEKFHLDKNVSNHEDIEYAVFDN